MRSLAATESYKAESALWPDIRRNQGPDRPTDATRGSLPYPNTTAARTRQVGSQVLTGVHQVFRGSEAEKAVGPRKDPCRPEPTRVM